MKLITNFAIVLLFFSCGGNKEKNQIQNIPNSTMDEQNIFIGTYTKKEGHVDGKGKGIYQITFHKNQKDVKSKLAFETINPSFLTISKDKKFLYAVNELGPNDGDSGTVCAFSIDEKTKTLTFINQQKTSGFAPCHIELDATGQLAIVTNYVGGVVSMFPIQKNGGLSEASQVLKYEGKGTTDRQEASHPHSARISPDNKLVFISDLGTDKIMIYNLDLENKKLLPTEEKFVKMVNGAGPRHFDFHPKKNFAYVVNELNSSVSVFDYDKSSSGLTEKQTIKTLPEGYSEFNLCADIHVHPSGKFLYVSNRGHNSLTIFKIDDADGTLKNVGIEPTRGDFPRNFTLEKDGNFLWVANQNSDNILQFQINIKNGLLKLVKEIEIPTPVCLRFWE